MSLNELPKTRSEGRELGTLFYFTGKPCKHGHVDKRYTSSSVCFACCKVYMELAKTGERAERGRAYQRRNNQCKYRKDWMAAYMRDYRKGIRRNNAARS